ncbi:hypothetical protein QJ857_gp0361 [Tupanvirus soda lake]|uniref:Uncharacterized protein n=2 Tax=Tupanvirus TaxID=2094720 RepID=A0A6N1NP33_9VIRU|nr:hypothetical protein QJ857_gp0361 [Tupanvirus soda lake]QKU35670.1 hypothetical protein [Tupanvirus soda lake]
MATYEYSLSQDFPNGINAALLDTQIRNDTTIQKFLFSIVTVESQDTVYITFDSSLTPAEETALDNIIAAHMNTSPGSNVVIQSPAADSSAIQILATDPAGGIIIQSGQGGININTTNTFSVNSGAESNITVTNGNLVLDSTNSLTNIDGYSGINIGNNTNNGPVNIGTNAQRNINIGNTNGSTGVFVNTGLGGFTVDTSNGPVSIDAFGSPVNLSVATTGDNQDLTIGLTGSTESRVIISSEGTGADAIFLNSAGGVNLTSNTQPINIISNNNVGNAVNIDTSAAGGGIIISSGSFGIGINSNGGALGIGHFSGGPIYFGTVASRDIFIGNNNAGTNIYQRHGNALIVSQPEEFTIPDADTNLTTTNLLSKILVGAPTADRTLTLPLLSDITTTIPNLIAGDAFDFSIINTSTTNNIIIGSPVIGNPNIAAQSSALFRIRLIGTPTLASYNIYRLAA